MRKASFVVAVATLVLGTHFASAQSAGHAQAGRLSLQHGVELRYQGDAAGALVEFRRSYDESPTPLALAQMGLAEQALGQWVIAEIHVRAALAIHSDGWIESHREELGRFYAEILRHLEAPRVVEAAPTASAPAVAPRVDPPMARAPAPQSEVAAHDGRLLWTGAGAVVLLGLGFTGLGIRESIVTNYNRNCRGLGDPSPTSACDESTNVSRANAATALGATGLITGGLLGIVTALLAVSSQSHSRLALRCGGGPGDVGISCGGVL